MAQQRVLVVGGGLAGPGLGLDEAIGRGGALPDGLVEKAVDGDGLIGPDRGQGEAALGTHGPGRRLGRPRNRGQTQEGSKQASDPMHE